MEIYATWLFCGERVDIPFSCILIMQTILIGICHFYVLLLQGLYRSTLSHLRYVSAASSHKVAANLIAVMSLLLKQSLAHPKAEQINNKTNKSALTLLMKVVDQAKQSSKDNKKGSTVLPQSTKLEKSFKEEVNSRLPGLISVLLGLIPPNRSRLVRKSGLDLCHTILIESWHIWTEDNADTLGMKAFEYCLVLLSDDDGKKLLLHLFYS